MHGTLGTLEIALKCNLTSELPVCVIVSASNVVVVGVLSGTP